MCDQSVIKDALKCHFKCRTCVHKMLDSYEAFDPLNHQSVQVLYVLFRTHSSTITAACNPPTLHLGQDDKNPDTQSLFKVMHLPCLASG